MKIIEAMKRVKMNEEKITDLHQKIAQAAAQLSIETPLYENQKGKVREWLQSCEDISQENIRLLIAIQRTNLATSVTIELGTKQVTKTIAEWVWRRRKYATLDLQTWQKLTDKGIKEGVTQGPGGSAIEVKLVRHYDPELRDARLTLYREEPHVIDSVLEIVNATTDLVE